jgi:sarcosine oxidase/L-pipecolate oxidase
MRYLRHRVESLNRVTFVHGTVRRLLFSADGHHVLGAHLADANELLHAELTILAAGAWTPSLVDLRGILQATGQVMAYIPLSDAEASELSKTPVQLNMSTGLFVIPPPPPAATSATSAAAEQHISPSSTSASKQLFLKIARHAHGYTNPTKIPHPELPNQTITISIPRTNPKGVLAHQPLPVSALSPLRSFLVQLFAPAIGHAAAAGSAAGSAAMAHRPFSHTRLCHYADTPTGDFLLDYHPKYGHSLFVASGGSGHAFKFLPVLGACVVDCVRGQCAEEFRSKWAWRKRVEGDWSTADGSRGGEGLLQLEYEDLYGRMSSKL